MVVADEAQAIKNAGTKQARAVRALRARCRLALTGTPVENRLGDLWSIFAFSNPGLLGTEREFSAFVKGLEAAPRTTAYGPLRALVQPYILRRLKTQKQCVADLPDKTEVKAFCGLSRKQTALYQQAVRGAGARPAGRRGHGPPGPGAVVPDPAQADLQPPLALAARRRAGIPEDSGKLHRLGELVDEIAAPPGQGAGVHPVQGDDRAAGRVPGRALRAARAGAVGRDRRGAGGRSWSTSSRPRTGRRSSCCRCAPGGTGLNLTAASHVIHFDRWWNPAVEDQATDRAFRIGQKRNVLVHKLICRGTLEERIDALIESKRDLSRQLVGARTAGVALTELSNEEILRLVRLDVRSASRRRLVLTMPPAALVRISPPTSRPRRSAPASRRPPPAWASSRGGRSSPMRIEGQAITSTFWGKAWCENLESYADFAYRLDRGRSYVRIGRGGRPADRRRAQVDGPGLGHPPLHGARSASPPSPPATGRSWCAPAPGGSARWWGCCGASCPTRSCGW